MRAAVRRAHAQALTVLEPGGPAQYLDILMIFQDRFVLAAPKGVNAPLLLFEQSIALNLWCARRDPIIEWAGSA